MRINDLERLASPIKPDINGQMTENSVIDIRDAIPM